MAEQKSIGGIEVLGPASINCITLGFKKYFFYFKLEQFTLYGYSAVSDLPLR
jgi:hypothetical protein